MSSTRPNAPFQTQQATSSAPSFEPTAKKKFGKNLNKLTKPPAPPIASSGGFGVGAGAAGRVGGAGGSASSRNGLLLLSTKRLSSSSHSVPSSLASTGGLLSGHKSSSAPRVPTSGSFRRDSGSTSAHDALLTAAAAAAGRVVEKNQPPSQQPHAWGLGEKQQRPEKHQHPTQMQHGVSSHMQKVAAAGTSNPLVLAPKGGVSSGYHAPASSSSHDIGLERKHHDAHFQGPQQGVAAGVSKASGQVTPTPSRFGASAGKIHTAGSSHVGVLEMESTDGKDFHPPPLASDGERATLARPASAQPGQVMPHSSSTSQSRAATARTFLSSDDTTRTTEGGGQNSAAGLEKAKSGGEGAHGESTNETHQVPRAKELADIADLTNSSGSVERPTHNADAKNGGKMNDEQVQFMSRLAKQRAEKRRLEEEARMNEQRERAARRLKELEEKISSVPSPAPSSVDRVASPDVGSGKSCSKTHSKHHASAATDHLRPETSSSAQSLPRKGIPSEVGNWRQHQKLPKGTAVSGSVGGASQVQKSEIVLERLGRTKKGGGGGLTRFASGTEGPAASSHRPTTNAGSSGRTLFDPNRTYSSLVGGSSAPQKGSNSKPNDDTQVIKIDLNQQHQVSPLMGGHAEHTQFVQGRSPGQHQHGAMQSNDDQPPIPVIHLSSYEDRDRGERKNSAAPRMLFDPKSGSMVAVTSRDEIPPGGKNGRKERSKQKNRSSRDRDSKDRDDSVPVTLVKRSDSNGFNEVSTSNSRNRSGTCEDCGNLFDASDHKSSRRQKGRKDESSQRKDRKRLERESRLNSMHSAGSDGPASPSSSFNEKGAPRVLAGMSYVTTKHRQGGGRNATGKHVSEVPRMPRTCGVLYKLDENGTYVCADGCEADQGYGAHSVPGGRVRNPVAHAQFLEERQRQQQEAANSQAAYMRDHQMGLAGYVNDSTGSRDRNPPLNNYIQRHYEDQQMDYYYPGDYEFTDEFTPEESHAVAANQLQLGFSRKNTRSVEDETQTKGPDTGSETSDYIYDLPSPLRVKPNEKIELLIGDVESPTLQATAHAWAPSEAALAAAVAASAAQASSTGALDAVSVENDIEAAPLNLSIIDDSTQDESGDDDLQGSPGESFVGLGFDPTENMDSVMMSPSHRSDGAAKESDPVDLASLSLGASGPIERSSTTSNNPFAPLSTPSQFLGSSTWGTGGSSGTTALGSLTSWDMLGTGNKSGTSLAQTSNNNGGQQQTVSAASFLSLSPLSVNHDSKTWGTGGLAGLGPLTTHSNSKSTGQTTD